MKTLTAIITLLTVLSTGICQAETPRYTGDALADLPGVAISVEPVAETLGDKGMTAFVFSVEIERRLKDAGIPVILSDTEPIPGNATLYIAVTAVIDEYVEHCAYSIRLEFIQDVRLERAPDVTLPGIATWSAGGVGVYAKGWRQAMLDDVVTYTDEFIDAFLAANPSPVE